MKSSISAALAATTLLLSLAVSAQKVDFTEYDLENGLHVILHTDKSAPVVAVTVMYHVGSKNEDTARTGFAHFFEHLLFEGSDNIKRGEFMKFVSSNGGENNANTSHDRTFYYEVFPSNQLETGLWLESERMMHPVINDTGVNTQREVIKEEKRLRIDNQPYAQFQAEILKRIYTKHPYRWSTIGSMEHLNAAKLDEFLAFFKRYYAPNNAVLSIAGDIDIEKTKNLVKAYFGEIPKGVEVKQPDIKEAPISTGMVDTAYDANIQIPAIMLAYRIPGIKEKDEKVMNLVSEVLSGGASSRLRKKMVDEKKNALQVGALNLSGEDYSTYVIYGLPNADKTLEELMKDMDEEIVKLQTSLISNKELQKLRNTYESQYADVNLSSLRVAEELAAGYTYHRNTGLINTELSEYMSITSEDIRAAAKKYLNNNQRLVLYYLPKK
ncbi:MAG: pitrilysin family protein [Chitinophagaceae bacterium]